MAEEEKKRNTNNRSRNTVIVVLIVALLLLVVFYDSSWPTKFDEWAEGPKPVKELEPASVELYKFSDLYNNETINIEVWLMNIGEKTATDIVLFVRARNETGSILYSKEVSLTNILLRNNETASGIYYFDYLNSKTIEYTIEIYWSDGKTAYTRRTILT